MYQLLYPFPKSPYRTHMNSPYAPQDNSNWIIFGIGSHHGDDQLGWQALNDLSKLGLPPLPPNTPVLPLRRPSDLIDFALENSSNSLQNHATCNSHVTSNTKVNWILIDACINSAPITNPSPIPIIHRWLWPNIPSTSSINAYCSSHAIGIFEILQLLETLKILPEEVWIYGIEPAY